jgi:pyruvate,water dikinase
VGRYKDLQAKVDDLMDAVVWLEEVGKNDLSTVGGKGASLGEMINIGVPVPGGFAVTAQAFRDFLNRTGIAKKLFEALNVDVNQENELHKAEETAKKLIMEAKVPKDIEQAIKSRYEELCKREGEQVFVAVRSSATAEDLPDASFAGQQETLMCGSAGRLFMELEPSFTGWSRASSMIKSISLPLCRRWWTPRNQA